MPQASRETPRTAPLSTLRPAGSRPSISFSALALAIASTIGVAAPRPTSAATCTVPGTHPRIAAAVADASCTQIQLAAQTYPESPTIRRSLGLAGPSGGGAIVQGRLAAVGAGVVVQVATLTVDNGCRGEAMVSSGGARVDADRVTVVLTPGSPCLPELPFTDTFESAATTWWSLSQP
jgi:hypothetical protein